MVDEHNLLSYVSMLLQVKQDSKDAFSGTGFLYEKDKQADSYLGLVWKKEFIDEIINGNMREVLPF